MNTAWRSRMVRFSLRKLFLWMAVVALVLTAYRSWPLDGAVNVLLYQFVDEDDTVFADGYTDEAFRTVRATMKREEVYALLGPPINQRQHPDEFKSRPAPGETVECWTRTPNDGDYKVREIVFKGDIVVRRYSEFYFD